MIAQFRAFKETFFCAGAMADRPKLQYSTLRLVSVRLCAFMVPRKMHDMLQHLVPVFSSSCVCVAL